MTHRTTTHKEAEDPRGKKPQTERPRIPRWKKALLGLSVCLILAGLALSAYGYFTATPQGDDARRQVLTDRKNTEGPDPGVDPKGLSPLGQSFFPESGGVAKTERRPDVAEGTLGEEARVPSELGAWSPVLVRGGLSFLVGFSVGYALRTFFRLTALVLGLVCLVLFGLSYAEVLPPIDWTAIEAHFDSAVSYLKQQASGFKSFIAGNLPSAGLAAAGIFTGFKKN